MVSFTFTLLALASAVAVSADIDYPINTTAVPLSTKTVWCRDQRANCFPICQEFAPGPVEANDCEPENLVYNCICDGGVRPNLSEYSMTIPFHKCQQFGNECVAKCGLGNNQCASDCRENNLCGAQEPKRVNVTSTSAAPTSSATSNSNQVYDGLAGDGGDDSSDEDSGASALAFGQAYGLVVVMTSLFAGFAIML